MDEIDSLLNKKSGLLGMCGDNDMREVLRRAGEGDEAASLAFAAYVHRLKKYIGAYSAVLGRVDAVAFTAGVGENAHQVREAALDGLAELGLVLDLEANAARSRSRGWFRRSMPGWPWRWSRRMRNWRSPPRRMRWLPTSHLDFPPDGIFRYETNR